MKPVQRTIEVRVTPVPKPRQTKRDVWAKRPCVLRYRAFADAMRVAAAKYDWKLPDNGLRIRFDLPMPKSWSLKKQYEMVGKPHQQKPDIDNLVKSVLDALSSDDCSVWQITAEKRWALSGMVSLSETLTEIPA